tara:strand:- start:3177 stop:5756 length:2580 start_codon:yes stop_codon:yes gene_type:complete
VLLPTEIELCEILGISEDEYWLFEEKISAISAKRNEAYELIPDIQAGSVLAYKIGTTTVGAILGKVAIAAALSYVGYLLTPKPRPINRGVTLEGSDAIGSKRFSPQFAFNTVQELATLGDTVPLVFANRNKGIGGVRVNGQLLWSKLLSLGRFQQLKAIVMFSLGEIDDRPDFSGYAIGDLLLSTYSKKKLDLFFKSSEMNENNRISDANRYTESEVVGMPFPYPDDVFADTWRVGTIPSVSGGVPNDLKVAAFSGTRNPTTQATFGLYSPMPNANVVKLPYEFVFETKGMDKKAIRALAVKRKKINTFWPTRAGFVGFANNNPTVEGNEVAYQILENVQEYVDDMKVGTKPHGVEDVISMVRSIREEIDSNIVIGEMYMAGDGLIVCTDIEDISTEAPDGTPWRQNESMYSGIERKYIFKVVEPSSIDYDAALTPFKVTDLRNGHGNIPQWTSDETRVGSEDGYRLNQDMTDITGPFYARAFRNPILQKVAMATVTNSRPCSITEIGLKSKVFGSIRGTNLNTIPEQSVLDDIFEDRGNFQAGTIDLYIKRYSFFKLQVRNAGGNGVWNDINNEIENEHSGLFCVKGNSPDFQYNYIKIIHPGMGMETNSQFEFRFKPYNGNNVLIKYINQEFNLLNATLTKSWQTGQNEASFVCKTQDYGTFVIEFAGISNLLLTHDDVSNTEWIKSYNRTIDLNSGPVAELSSSMAEGSNPMTHIVYDGPIYEGPPVDNTPVSYNYDTTSSNHNETLISLNKSYGLPGAANEWAWVAYVDGKEVGVHFGKAGESVYDIEIEAKNEITLVGRDGELNNTYKLKIDPVNGEDPFVDENPVDVANGESNPREVAYYKIERPDTNLTIYV